MKISIVVLFSSLLLVQGCTWVKLTEEGQKARVLSANEVLSCRKVGSTTVSVEDNVVGFKRNPEAIEENLQALARNAASDLKGDTVVPKTNIENGQQTYDVYRCIGK